MAPFAVEYRDDDPFFRCLAGLDEGGDDARFKMGLVPQDQHEEIGRSRKIREPGMDTGEHSLPVARVFYTGNVPALQGPGDFTAPVAQNDVDSVQICYGQQIQDGLEEGFFTKWEELLG